MNHVILIGNVGKADSKKVNETSLFEFSIATNKRYKTPSGEFENRATWHNCAAWGTTADAMTKFVEKGRKIAIIGEIENQSWEKDGEKRYKTVIRVNSFEMLNSKASTDVNPDVEPQETDLPF